MMSRKRGFKGQVGERCHGKDIFQYEYTYKENSCFERIMQLIHLRSIINILATLVGILAVILVFFLPDYSVLIFSLEVILLPTIYIVGNVYIEEKIKEEYEQIISSIGNDSKYLKEQLLSEIFKVQNLKSKLNERNLKNGR